jgi:hypothetical protein
MKDSPTNTSATVANYCVLNPLDVNAITSITEANLYSSLTASASAIVRSTIAVTSGKYYWEVTFGSTGDTLMVGVCDATTSLTNSLWSTSNAWMYYSNNGNKYNSSGTAYGATFTNTDIIGVALDMDAGTLTFYKNNVSQGVAYNSGLTGKTLTPTIQSAARALTAYANFGQRPFAYTPPTGFVALNTYNLPTPTILQGNKYMDATLYTGTGSSLSVTNAGSFQPDLVWVKGRSGATDHAWYDSVRGTTKQIESNNANAETTEAQGLTAFGTGGFTVGTLAQMNTSAATYVGWQWKASNAAGVTNTSGSITSTVSVNATAGFSVVGWTSDGSASIKTMGHGLGVAPVMIIVRRRDSTGGTWYVYHKSLSIPNDRFIKLNSTDGEQNPGNTIWSTSSTTFGFYQSNIAVNGNTCIGYAWAEIAGFSRFGSYTGNGSADGPFIATNFAPKFVMIKRTDTTNDWEIHDTSRSAYNVSTTVLAANLSSAESAFISGYELDILSNGFKLRSSGNVHNASGGTYIYAAFASNPFKNSNAR